MAHNHLWRAAGELLAEKAREDASFWGPITATLDWCEENYVLTSFVAEFWNTLSNAAIVGLALYGLRQSTRYRLESQFVMCYFALLCVGIGSTLFHATLLYPAQMLDELPMIWATSVFLYAIPSQQFREKHRILLIVFVISYSLVITVAYTINKSAIFHETAYGAGVVLLVYQAIMALKRYPRAERELSGVLKLGSMAFGGAYVLWNIDNVFCSYIRRARKTAGWPVEHLSQLHAWWHVGTGIGTYCFVVFCSMLRQLECGESRPRLRWSVLAPGVAVPYVYSAAV
mmetsp:Transcript_8204/g.15223  ORF Transcript_8204/g.15223 Transcript_8204/m.15223 type:complete len:286 (-) Transcript_8204:248-1105(-)